MSEIEKGSQNSLEEVGGIKKLNYQPKLRIGDKVWIMEDNKPIDVKIEHILITYSPLLYESKATSTKKNTSIIMKADVKYLLESGHKVRQSIVEETIWSKGTPIYMTKKDLLNSL